MRSPSQMLGRRAADGADAPLGNALGDNVPNGDVPHLDRCRNRIRRTATMLTLNW